ncbi:MAG TPA: tRNA nucleotidyltransferase, partial [Ignavibacteria bacterium]
MMDFINSNKIVKQIAAIARKENIQAFLVGGYVRDKLLGKQDTDIDITIIGNAIDFAEKTAESLNTQLAAVYDKFGTALLSLANFENENEPIKIEFASARKESYRKDSRKPIVEFSDLKDDLSRRDFTVNALAVSLNDDKNDIVDYFGGQKDLKDKILRTPFEPYKTFDDDPLRIMRACRFASQLGFIIASETFEAMKQMRERLKLTDDKPTVVSQERIT